VATLLQEDSSAIAVKSDSSILSLRDLGQSSDKTHTYASYEGRFEMAIIRHMVTVAGGDGKSLKERGYPQ
jgi:hypothetical protein